MFVLISRDNCAPLAEADKWDDFILVTSALLVNRRLSLPEQAPLTNPMYLNDDLAVIFVRYRNPMDDVTVEQLCKILRARLGGGCLTLQYTPNAD